MSVYSQAKNHFGIKQLPSWKAWLLAARPKTLTASWVPVIAATALAVAQGFAPRWDLMILALLSATAIQVGTNLVNDAMDFKKGADTETRLGPVRVTQMGIFSPGQVLKGAYVCFALAAFLGLPLMLHGGLPIFWVGVFSLLCAYAYTGGPFPLAYWGLGDLFVLIFFGLVAVQGMFFLHAGQLTSQSWLLGFQVGALSTVLIAINNLRDRAQDVLVKKRTLAVLLGEKNAKREIILLLAFPFLTLPGMAGSLGVPGVLLALLAAPLAFALGYAVWRTPPGAVYNRFLGQSAGVHLLFGLLFAVGIYYWR